MESRKLLEKEGRGILTFIFFRIFLILKFFRI